jgi:excisionase family DNA binding protein
LIREIVVDVDEQNSEVILLIHWKGGVHTPLRLPRRRRGQSNGHTSKDVIEAVRSLARICNDQMIAGVLNRAKLLTGHGNFWSRQLITSLRHRNGVDCYDAQRQTEQGWINLSQAAQLLGTTRNTLREAIERGEISAERPISCGPWILNRQSLQSESAQQFMERVRSSKAHPTTANSKQCSLDLSTTYEKGVL